MKERGPAVGGSGWVIYNLEIAPERVASAYTGTGREFKDGAKDAIGRELERIIAVLRPEIYHPQPDGGAGEVGWDLVGGERPKRNPPELHDFMTIRIDDELQIAAAKRAADIVEEETGFLARGIRGVRQREAEGRREIVIVLECVGGRSPIVGEIPDIAVGEAGRLAHARLTERDEPWIFVEDRRRRARDIVENMRKDDD